MDDSYDSSGSSSEYIGTFERNAESDSESVPTTPRIRQNFFYRPITPTEEQAIKTEEANHDQDTDPHDRVQSHIQQSVPETLAFPGFDGPVKEKGIRNDPDKNGPGPSTTGFGNMTYSVQASAPEQLTFPGIDGPSKEKEIRNVPGPSATGFENFIESIRRKQLLGQSLLGPTPSPGFNREKPEVRPGLGPAVRNLSSLFQDSFRDPLRNPLQGSSPRTVTKPSDELEPPPKKRRRDDTPPPDVPIVSQIRNPPFQLGNVPNPDTDPVDNVQSVTPIIHPPFQLGTVPNPYTASKDDNQSFSPVSNSPFKLDNVEDPDTDPGDDDISLSSIDNSPLKLDNVQDPDTAPGDDVTSLSSIDSSPLKLEDIPIPGPTLPKIGHNLQSLEDPETENPETESTDSLSVQLLNDSVFQNLPETSKQQAYSPLAPSPTETELPLSLPKPISVLGPAPIPHFRPETSHRGPEFSSGSYGSGSSNVRSAGFGSNCFEPTGSRGAELRYEASNRGPGFSSGSYGFGSNYSGTAESRSYRSGANRFDFPSSSAGASNPWRRSRSESEEERDDDDNPFRSLSKKMIKEKVTV